VTDTKSKFAFLSVLRMGMKNYNRPSDIRFVLSCLFCLNLAKNEGKTGCKTP